MKRFSIIQWDRPCYKCKAMTCGGDCDDRPIEWVESEESMRGAPLRAVLARDDVTIIWHHKKPVTNNPVWEVLGQ